MIQAFTYRIPRLALELPVEFETPGGTLFGLTRNLNERGMLVTFGEPQLIGQSGKLRFRVGQCLLEFEANVGHAEGFLSGLIFNFRSPDERIYLQSALKALMRGDSSLPAE